jgi:Protein of unknown function (DUF1769)
MRCSRRRRAFATINPVFRNTKLYLRCIVPSMLLLASAASENMITEQSSPPSSSSSLMKGMWEAAASTPSPPSSQGSQCALDDDDESEELLRVQFVETRLLELVEQQEHQQHLHSSVDDNITAETTARVFDKNAQAAAAVNTVVLPIHRPHAYPCADTDKKLPAPPSQWPQAPLMLRPTPGSHMKIRGIRYADSTEYQNFPGVCAGCILPVNNGRELPGKSLVVDFESPLFVGTLLMRVAGAATVDPQSTTTATSSYFDGKKRKFQVVIKGRFRHEGIPMSECVTGQVFERAAGPLPARWLVHALIKFVSVLAPQLEADLDGDRPRFLSPLVATAHTVLAKDHDNTSFTTTAATACIDCNSNNRDAEENHVNFSIYAGSATMEDEVEEPPSDDPCSVMSTVHAVSAAKTAGSSGSSSLAHRRAARKKAFNHVAAVHAAEPVFDTNKEYTFEFFQHLLLLTHPDDFKINMGSRVQVGLARSLDGQPIKILSARKCPDHSMQALWSFDLWHQALYPYAKAAWDEKTYEQ